MKAKQNLRPFHLAFPVLNIQKAEHWYTKILGCSIGRKSNDWIDLNLFGHQIVAHLTDNITIENTNHVDGNCIPIRHFGVILSVEVWHELVDRLNKLKIDFLIKPHVRFKNLKGEQHTLFITSPFDGSKTSISSEELVFTISP